MKAIINTRTQTERIELPDFITTGDIICAIADATEKFDDENIFIIALEDGREFYCLESPNALDKWNLYVREPGHDYYELVAEFQILR